MPLKNDFCNIFENKRRIESKVINVINLQDCRRQLTLDGSKKLGSRKWPLALMSTSENVELCHDVLRHHFCHQIGHTLLEVNPTNSENSSDSNQKGGYQ